MRVLVRLRRCRYARTDWRVPGDATASVGRDGHHVVVSWCGFRATGRAGAKSCGRGRVNRSATVCFTRYGPTIQSASYGRDDS